MSTSGSDSDPASDPDSDPERDSGPLDDASSPLEKR